MLKPLRLLWIHDHLSHQPPLPPLPRSNHILAAIGANPGMGVEAVDNYISKEGPDFPRSISGILGIFSSIAFAFFLIPPSINVRFWTSRSVGDHSPRVHLLALLNSMFWVLYALPFVQPNVFVITSNAAGGLIAVFYLLLFSIYSKSWTGKRRKVIAILVLEIIVVVIIATAVFSVVQDTKLRRRRLWIIALICQFGMHAVLFSEMIAVIAKKRREREDSIETSNESLAAVSLLNYMFWIMHAFLSFDLYLVVPNAMGFFISWIMVQVYPTPLPEEKNKNGALIGSVASNQSGHAPHHALLC